MMSIIGVVGSLGGALVGALIQRDAKRNGIKLEMLKQTVERYRVEIAARQLEEAVAVEWLVSLNASANPTAAKLALRDKTENEHGVRPGLSPSDVTRP